MEEIRSVVSIQAEFEDDSEWSAEGDLTVPAGKAVMKNLIASLKNRGIETFSLSQKDYYGWETSFYFSGNRYFLVLQLLDEWILEGRTDSAVRNLLNRQKTNTGLHEAMLVVHEVLISDNRVREVSWFTKQDFDSKNRPLGKPAP